MTNENISVTEVQNENSVIAERRAKLLKLREHGVAYPNDFVRKDLFGDLNEKYGSKTAEELAALAPKVACAGRVMLKRVMGRLTFATVRDYTGTMQYFVQESTVGEAAYADFKTLDLGDIVACEGTLMRTQAGDLAIKVTSFRLMAKSTLSLLVYMYCCPNLLMSYMYSKRSECIGNSLRYVFRSLNEYSTKASYFILLSFVPYAAYPSTNQFLLN